MNTDLAVVLTTVAVASPIIFLYHYVRYRSFMKRYEELRKTPLYETETHVVYGSGLRNGSTVGGYQEFSPKKEA